MPASDFVLNLREKIGNDLLLLPAALCILRDERGRVLLMEHADRRVWILPGGGIEPGETPAAAAVREVFEETGLQVEVTGIAGVFGGEEFQVAYPNGDRAAYLTVVFEVRRTGGELEAIDGEASELRYFARDELADLKLSSGSRAIMDALILNEPARYPYFK